MLARVQRGKPLVWYSGDDSRNEYIYKYVSKANWESALWQRQHSVKNVKELKEVFGECPNLAVNNTKSFIGHCMGAAGALELAGNLPSFEDGWIHPTINITEIDPAFADMPIARERKDNVKLGAVTGTARYSGCSS